MSTGGSRSIRDSQDYLRQAGAAARTMLIAAKQEPAVWLDRIRDAFSRREAPGAGRPVLFMGSVRIRYT